MLDNLAIADDGNRYTHIIRDGNVGVFCYTQQIISGAVQSLSQPDQLVGRNRLSLKNIQVIACATDTHLCTKLRLRQVKLLPSFFYVRFPHPPIIESHPAHPTPACPRS